MARHDINHFLFGDMGVSAAQLADTEFGARNWPAHVEDCVKPDAWERESGFQIPHEPWFGKALCGDIDPDELDFTVDEQGGANLEEKRAVCEMCPVQIECLDYAVREGIRHGFWGGMSAADRRRRRQFLVREMG